MLAWHGSVCKLFQNHVALLPVAHTRFCGGSANNAETHLCVILYMRSLELCVFCSEESSSVHSASESFGVGQAHPSV